MNKPTIINLILLLLFVSILPNSVFAIIRYSQESGRLDEIKWDITTGGAGSTIDFTNYDESGDTLIIQADHTVSFPGNDMTINSLFILGTFNQNANSGDLTITNEMNVLNLATLNSSEGTANLTVKNIHVAGHPTVTLANNDLTINHQGYMIVGENLPNGNFSRTATNISGELKTYSILNNGKYTLTANTTINNFLTGFFEEIEIITGSHTLTINGEISSLTSFTTSTTGSIIFGSNAFGTFKMTNENSDKIRGLTMNTDSTITFFNNVTVDSCLTLTNGKIFPIGNFTVTSNATITGQTISTNIATATSGGSDNSHVIGIMEQQFVSDATQKFYFLPVGNGSTLRTGGVKDRGTYGANSFTLGVLYSNTIPLPTTLDPSLNTGNEATSVAIKGHEFWNIGITATSEGAENNHFDVILTYDSNSGVVQANNSSLHLMHYHNDSSYWESYGVVSGDAEHHALTSNSGYLYAKATSFSPFTIGGIGGDHNLPVELTFFQGLKIEEGIKFKWQTATEVNNDFFELQGSKDNKIFETIKNIKGSGNSQTKRNYQYTLLNNELNENTFFRLKQVDFDGSFSYSNIININAINFYSPLNVQVFPNPTKDKLTINIASSLPNDDISFIKIYNLQGKEVQELAPNFSQIITIENLNAGLYFLHVKTKSGEHKKVRFSVL